MVERSCCTCKITKALDQFVKRKNRPDGRGYQCTDCNRQALKAWRKSNPAKHRAQVDRWQKKNPEKHRASARAAAQKYRSKNPGMTLQYNHGITLEQYTVLQIAQEGRCAICQTREPGGRSKALCVDHCHTTKKIRGLLCHACNSGLGFFERFQRLEVLNQVTNYLTRTLR